MTSALPPKLFPHQIAGAEWLSSMPRAGLHDEMGTGKTATAIEAIRRTGMKRGIIVCPATIKENWRRELIRWAPELGRNAIKGSTYADLANWIKRHYHILIISHAMAPRWAHHVVQEGPFGFLILDEAHAFKNPTAQRTIAIKGPESDGVEGLGGMAAYTWELSGTPIPNDPLDIFTFLRFSGAWRGSRADFVEKFFHVIPGRFSNRQVLKPGERARLGEIMRSVSLRRSLQDTGISLPPIMLTSTYLDGDSSKVRQYLDEHPGLDAAILAALDHGNLNLIDAAHVMTLRRLIGEAKALPFTNYLLETMDAGLKAPVIFGWHVSVLELVKEGLEKARYKVGLIHGGISEKERTSAVERFQKGELDALICNIQSGGEGITLTRASRLFMLESGWAPKDNAQAIKRIHRIGQSQHTRAEFVILSGSFDERIIGIVSRKVQAILSIDGQQLLAAPTQ
jgi:SWI/SNF-related matrix-associated actin-dependent regulator 1 of chromatin subfamily A